MMKMCLYLTCGGSDITSHIGQNSLDFILNRVIFLLHNLHLKWKIEEDVKSQNAHMVKSKSSSYLATQTHLDFSKIIIPTI